MVKQSINGCELTCFDIYTMFWTDLKTPQITPNAAAFSRIRKLKFLGTRSKPLPELSS